MKMNRFRSGMPALHRPFICSSWMKFTTRPNVCRSTCDCDKLAIDQRTIDYVIVYCTIDSSFDASLLKPQPFGSVIPRMTTPTTKFIPCGGQEGRLYLAVPDVGEVVVQRAKHVLQHDLTHPSARAEQHVGRKGAVDVAENVSDDALVLHEGLPVAVAAKTIVLVVIVR